MLTQQVLHSCLAVFLVSEEVPFSASIPDSMDSVESPAEKTAGTAIEHNEKRFSSPPLEDGQGERTPHIHPKTIILVFVGGMLPYARTVH